MNFFQTFLIFEKKNLKIFKTFLKLLIKFVMSLVYQNSSCQGFLHWKFDTDLIISLLLDCFRTNLGQICVGYRQSSNIKMSSFQIRN